MNIYEQFGKTVYDLRTELKISQENLAVSSGISPRYMSDIENGKRRISLDIADKIAKALNKSLSDLFLSRDELNK